MEFTGVITHKGQKETFNENFSKIDMRLEEVVDKQFPQSIVVTFANKMLEHAEKLNEGDIITAFLNFRTNESKKEAWKFFTSIGAWKVKSHEVEQDPADNF